MNSQLRILQLIDSLDAGGAERMAVNYANGLRDFAGLSALVSSRREGPLRAEIAQNVPYLCLHRKRTLDWAALYRLRHFVKTHRINVVHAHSTSFLMAVLLKFWCWPLRVVWHDHYGKSEFLEQRPYAALRWASLGFWGRIAVNAKLLAWGRKKLFGKNDCYLPNFVLESALKDAREITTLKGHAGKRILCLANLREQKGHFFLLDIAHRLCSKKPDWSFHLVGKDFEDAYATRLREKITDLGLENHVFVYGSRPDVAHVLRQSSIGILTSASEGLPVAVLEYGLFGLPAVLTRVGELPEIITTDSATLVDFSDVAAFTSALEQLIDDPALRQSRGAALHKLIYATFVARAVLARYTDWLSPKSNS